MRVWSEKLDIRGSVMVTLHYATNEDLVHPLLNRSQVFRWQVEFNVLIPNVQEGVKNDFEQKNNSDGLGKQ